MDEAELQAERELIDDLGRMASTVHAGIQPDDTRTVWKQRRAQIAALRERVRAMRDRHLGRFRP